MIRPYSIGRKLCITAGRRIGYFPASAKAGDVTCLLYRGDLPYVLRVCDVEEYGVVGDCSIDGVMHGELMEINAEAETFTLV